MKILALEDSRFALKLLERAIDGVAELVPAPSIASARKLLNYPFDLILTDLDLPDGTGQEFIVEVRNHPVCKHTPIMVISSILSQIEQQEISVLGCNDWMKKPVRPKILVDKINHLVSAPYSRIPEASFIPIQCFIWREGDDFMAFVPALKKTYQHSCASKDEFKSWLKPVLMKEDLPWDVAVPRFPESSTLLLPDPNKFPDILDTKP